MAGWGLWAGDMFQQMQGATMDIPESGVALFQLEFRIPWTSWWFVDMDLDLALLGENH